MADHGAALLLGLSPKDDGHMDHGSEYSEDDHGDEPNHEFESAAADAFHAAKSNDMDGFKKALYNAVCAVVDEEGDEDDDSHEEG